MKWILVTGSANEDAKKILFKDLFRVEIAVDSQTIDYTKNGYLISDYSNLSSISFDIENLKIKYRDKRKELTAIICIENLNPRPETLLNDFKILINIFSNEELKKRLYLFFTFSTKQRDLNELRKFFLESDIVFEYLNISNRERESFTNGRIWILHENNLRDLEKMDIIKKVNQTNIFYSIFDNLTNGYLPTQPLVNKPENNSNVTQNKSFEILNASDKDFKNDENRIENCANICQNCRKHLIENQIECNHECCKECLKHILNCKSCDEILFYKNLEVFFQKFQIGKNEHHHLVILDLVCKIKFSKNYHFQVQNLPSGSFVTSFRGYFDFDEKTNSTNELNFYNELFIHRENFFERKFVNAFILVVKDDEANSTGFLNSAKLFVKAFGQESINNLIVLCFQPSYLKRNNFEHLIQNLYESEGYKYLLDKKYSKSEIPCFLWNDLENNIKQINENIETFIPFTESHLKMSFNMIENQVEFLQKINRLECQLLAKIQDTQMTTTCNLI